MTGATAKLPPMMTVADFIDWPGDGTDTRYELVDGVLRAMSPPSDTHGLIHSNINRLVGNFLETNRPGCRVGIGSGVQPRLRAAWNFRVPDMGVTCKPNLPGARMLPDPILLIELLSPTNADDTWGNIPHYASLPSVIEILIVHTTSVKAELLRRGQDGSWPENPTIIDRGGNVQLQSIGMEFLLDVAYANTHLIMGDK